MDNNKLTLYTTTNNDSKSIFFKLTKTRGIYLGFDSSVDYIDYTTQPYSTVNTSFYYHPPNENMEDDLDYIVTQNNNDGFAYSWTPFFLPFFLPILDVNVEFYNSNGDLTEKITFRFELNDTQ